MTITLEDRYAGPARTAAPVTARENLITLFGGIWLTVGLFVDGYAHSNIIDTTTEDFFTPWHGLFYAGFTFSATWVAWLMYRRRNAQGVVSWIPLGYGGAVVGIGIFAAGGVGDMIWHTVFGIETGLDALLSPTHLLLLLGLVLVLAAPLQATINGTGTPWLAVASLTILTALGAFFTSYAHPISSSWLLAQPFNERNDIVQAWAVSGAIVTTALLTVPVLYYRRNVGTLPLGAVTTIWVVATLLEAVALSQNAEIAALSALGGGVVADCLLWKLKSMERRYRYLIAVSAGIGTVWTLWILLSHQFNDAVAWPPELFSGLVVVTMLAAAGLTLLAFPSATPEP